MSPPISHARSLLAVALSGALALQPACYTGLSSAPSEENPAGEADLGLPALLGGGAAPLEADVATAPLGTLPGEASVDSMGNLTYSVPIDIPQGRAGMQPTVTLTYNSGGGNGHLGVGWSLAASSEITRCPRNPLDDGGFAEIQMDDADALCLDGARLVLESGTHGMDHAVYRQRRDQLVRVVLHGDLAGATPWFEVLEPTGHIAHYGATDDARVTSNETAYRWSLNRVEDRYGNWMGYSYASDLLEWDDGSLVTEGEVDHRLVAIDYTGHGSLAPDRRIDFVYDPRCAEDQPLMWQHGAPVQHRTLLSRITTSVGGTTARDYAIRYDDQGVSRKNRISHIRLCDGHGGCLPATDFELDNGDQGLDDDIAEFESFDGHSFPGIEDVGGTPIATWRMVGDIDGDYSTDPVFVARPNTLEVPDKVWRVWLSPGTDGAPVWDDLVRITDIEADLVPLNPGFESQLNFQRPDMRPYVVDFNDDIYDDVMYFAGLVHDPDENYLAMGNELRVLRNIGGADVFEEMQFALPPQTFVISGFFPDLDGDGFNDVLMCAGLDDTSATWRYALNEEFVGGGPVLRTFDLSQGGVDTGVACSIFDEFDTFDANGDGGTDLLVIPARDSSGTEIPDAQRGDYRRLELDFGAGTGVLVPSGLPRDRVQRWWASGWHKDQLHPRSGEGLGSDRIADINGDGLADVYRFELVTDGPLQDAIDEFFSDVEGELVSEDPPTSELVVRAWYNTGDSFARGPVAYEFDDFNDFRSHWARAAAVDWNRDGKTDLLVPPASAPWGPNAWTDLEVLISRGEIFESLPTDIEIALQLTIPGGRHEVMILDLDGDGSSDVGALNASAGTFDLKTSRARVPDRITAIVDGLGARTEIDYGNTSDPAVYTSSDDTGTGERAPDHSISSVVTQIRRDTGVLNVGDDWFAETYHYYDAWHHRYGRGSLGFSRIRTIAHNDDVVQHVIDRRYGATDVSTDVNGPPGAYDYPEAHTVVEETVQVPLGDGAGPTRTRVSQRHLHYTTIDTIPGAYLRRINQDRTTQHEIDGCSEPLPAPFQNTEICDPDDTGIQAGTQQVFGRTETNVKAFDAFGHPTEVETIIDNGVSTRTVSRTFDNDTTNWILGEVRSTTINDIAEDGSAETRTTTTTWNANGKVSSVTREPSDPDLRIRTYYRYDEFGNLERQTRFASGTSRVDTIEWSPDGIFPEEFTNAAGHTRRVQYDPVLTVPLWVSEPSGVAQRMLYDGLGRNVGSSRHKAIGGGATGSSSTVLLESVTTGGEPHGRVTTTVAGGGTRVSTLDRLGRAVEVCASNYYGSQSCAEIDYDGWFRVHRTSLPTMGGAAPAGHRTFHYDHLGRVLEDEAPDGSSVTVAYNTLSWGTSTTVTDPDLHPTQYERDGLGRTTRIIDAMGTATCFEHGPFSTVTTIQRDCTAASPPPPATITYDTYGRRLTYDSEATGAETRSYDAWGNVVAEVDANDDLYEFEYDAIDRMTRRIDPDGESEWIYDTKKMGYLSRTISATGVERDLEYDAVARLSSSTLHVSPSSSYEVSYEYDAFERLHRITYPLQAGITPVAEYTYDGAGHLTSVSDPSSGLQYWQVADYDEAGRITEELFGNNVTTESVFDPLTGQLEGIISQSPIDGAIQSTAYGWTAAGDLDWRFDVLSGQNEDFDYDQRHRLRQIDATTASGPLLTEAFYDDLGNITARTDVGAYAYTGDRLDHAGSHSYTYDDAGRVLTRDGSTFDYAAIGRPRSITTATDLLLFEYDADGGRVGRRQGAERRTYVDGLFEEIRSPTIGPFQIQYRNTIVAPGGPVAELVNTPDASGAANTSVRYLHDDHLGSLEVVTDSTGAEVAGSRRSYDAWGGQRDPGNWSVSGSFFAAVDVNLGFTGHMAQPDDGLINMIGRSYDPAVGRFVSPDPLVPNPMNPEAYNRYAYVYNNPLSLTDPFGFAPDEDHDDIWDGDRLMVRDPTICGSACSEAPSEASSTGADGGSSGSGDKPVSGGASGSSPYGVTLDLGPAPTAQDYERGRYSFAERTAYRVPGPEPSVEPPSWSDAAANAVASGAIPLLQAALIPFAGGEDTPGWQLIVELEQWKQPLPSAPGQEGQGLAMELIIGAPFMLLGGGLTASAGRGAS